MDLNHGSTGYEPVGISGRRKRAPTAFLTTLPRCGAAIVGAVYERWRRSGDAYADGRSAGAADGRLRASFDRSVSPRNSMMIPTNSA